jgi:hypothetical protein
VTEALQWAAKKYLASRFGKKPPRRFSLGVFGAFVMLIIPYVL